MQVIDRNGNILLERQMPRVVRAKVTSSRIKLTSPLNKTTRPKVVSKADFDGGNY